MHLLEGFFERPLLGRHAVALNMDVECGKPCAADQRRLHSVGKAGSILRASEHVTALRLGYLTHFPGQDFRLLYIGSDATGDAEWFSGECLITCQRSWPIAEGVLPIPQTPDDAASDTSAVLPVEARAGDITAFEHS